MPNALLLAIAVIAGTTASGGAGPDAAGADPGTGGRPIRLDVQETPGRVVLKVVGKSDAPVEASYTLKVAARGHGGTNETSQAGQVRLVPGREVTVIDLSVASGADASWTAVLDVARVGGPAYTIRRTSGEGAR